MGHFTSSVTGVQIQGWTADSHLHEYLPVDIHRFHQYCAKPGYFPTYRSQHGGEADDDDHGEATEEEDLLGDEVTHGSNEITVPQHANAAAEACSKHNPSTVGPISSEEDLPSALRLTVSPPPPPRTPSPNNGAKNTAKNSSEPLPCVRLQSKILPQYEFPRHTKMPAAFEVPIGPIESNDSLLPLFDTDASFEKQNQGIWNVCATQCHTVLPRMILESCNYASTVPDYDELPDASLEKQYAFRGDWFDGYYESSDLVMMNADLTSAPVFGDDLTCKTLDSSHKDASSRVSTPKQDDSSADQDMEEDPTPDSNSEDENNKPSHDSTSCTFPASDEVLREGRGVVVNGLKGDGYAQSIRFRELIKEILSHFCSCNKREGVCDVHHYDEVWLWEAPDIEDKQLELAQRLFACAEAVACRDGQQARSLLEQVRRMASPYGNPFQRVMACFAEGLAARMEQLGSGPGRSIMPPRTMLEEAQKQEGFDLMYKHCPYVQFGHFVANCAILEAVEGEKAVHVIDLGMAQSVQWPSLMDALKNQEDGAPRRLRITGVGGLKEGMERIGEKLKQEAKKIGLEFEFRAVEGSLEGVAAAELELREGEAVVVNGVMQLHRVVKESRGSLNAVLQVIHALAPKVLTLVEQDANHNGPFFLRRFMAALHYYSAIFDSLEATAALPRYSTRRVKIEQFHFAQEIHNIVACEGPARVERHERVDQWRRRMSRAGFQPSPLRLLQDTHRWLAGFNASASDAYTLADEKGCLVLGWKGQPIVAASAWRC